MPVAMYFQGANRMGIRDLYREVMALNMMDDNDRKESVARTFFQKLNGMKLPE